MALIEINMEPSRKDLKVFSVTFLALFALLSFLALRAPHTLLVAGIVTGVAFVVGLAFNDECPRRRQLLGAVIPSLLTGVFALVRAGVPSAALVAILLAVGLAGAIVIWVSEPAGKRLYVGWMSAAMPIGWTISQLLLGAVYYVVITPIGLIMRAVGRDPMRRRFDPQAKSYWIDHRDVEDMDRYFRQF